MASSRIEVLESTSLPMTQGRQPPTRITLDLDAWDDSPAPEPEVSDDSPTQLVPAAEALPAAALPGLRRRRYFHARRRHDPLGKGHITTWRTRNIKVACEVVISTRRLVIRLSAS